MRVLAVSLLAALVGTTAFAAESAPDPSPPTEEELHLAQVLIDFLSPEDWSHGFTWGGVAVRTGNVRWHLSDPGDDDRDPVYFRRTGWAEFPGSQSWVTACGTEETLMVATARGDDSFMGGELDRVLDPRIIAALEAKGAVMEEISRGETNATHRISVEGRFPGELDQTRVCTSRNSAAAQSCETRYTLVLDATKLHEAEELRGRCSTSGIWW